MTGSDLSAQNDAMHRTKGTCIGLLEGGRVNEWVVTEKLGDALKTKLLSRVVPRKSCFQWGETKKNKNLLVLVGYIAKKLQIFNP